MNHFRTDQSEDRRELRVAALLIGVVLLAGIMLNCLGIARAVSGQSF
jgi:hypothetical protein